MNKMLMRTAVFSPCRTWRYQLFRQWSWWLPLATFICLNCSTADETQDDPTVRRCIRYAYDWGYGGLIMTNLFAFRATDPRVMKATPDPVGPKNDWYLKSGAIQSEIVVAAWGNHGGYRGRSQEVVEFLRQMEVNLMCLGITKTGEPKHPLYLPKNQEVMKYAPIPTNR